MRLDGAFRRGSSSKTDLPDGKTCGDCIHSARCCTLYSRIPEDEVCDWSPSMFRERVPESAVVHPSWFDVPGAPSAVAPKSLCEVCGGQREKKIHAIGKSALVTVDVCTRCLSTQEVTPAEDAAAMKQLVEIGKFAMGRSW